jgi:hypothetical protein
VGRATGRKARAVKHRDDAGARRNPPAGRVEARHRLAPVRSDVVLARDRDAGLSHQSNHPVT